jgi:hypothetical protein
MNKRDMIKAIVEYRLEGLDPDVIKRYAGYFLATDYDDASEAEVAAEYERLMGDGR